MSDDDEIDLDPGAFDDDELDEEAIRGALAMIVDQIDHLTDPLEIWDGIAQAVPMALVVGDGETARRLIGLADSLHDEGFDALFTSRIIQLQSMVAVATGDDDLLTGALERLDTSMATLDETSLATHLVLLHQLLGYGRPDDAQAVAWRLVALARDTAATRPVLAAASMLRAADGLEDCGDRLSAAALTDASLELLDVHRGLVEGPDAPEYFEETPEEADALRADIALQGGWIAWRAEQVDRAADQWAVADAALRALATEGADEAADNLLRWRAKAADLLGRTDEAVTLYERAAETSARHDWPEDRARSLLGLAHIAKARGELDHAEALATEAAGISGTLGDLTLAGDISQQLLKVAMLRGNLPEARRLAEERVDQLRAAFDRDSLIIALRDAGQLRSLTGDLDGALVTLREALAMAIEDDWVGLIHEIQHAVATVLTTQCRWAEALELLDDALRTAEDTANALGIANVVWFQGRIAMAAGLDGAAEAFERARQIAEEIQITRYGQYLAQDGARLALADGDLEAAARHLETARAIGADLDDAVGQSDTATVAAELDLHLGDPDRARQRCTAALLEHEATTDLTMQVRDHLVLGRADAAQGRAGAAEALRNGLALAQRTGMLDAEVIAHVALAEVLDGPDAVRHAEAARDGWAELTRRRPAGAPEQRWREREQALLGRLDAPE